MTVDRRLFLAGGLALSACVSGPRTSAVVDVPPLWGRLKAGPYAPGFAVDWVQNGPRRIQRWRWYPAIIRSGRPMRVADYGAAYVAGGPAGWPTDPRAIYATGYDEPGDTEKFARLMDLAVAARADAGPPQGRMPLVVLGQGFGYESPFWQAVLAEYLASWGYRVVTAPLSGAAGPKTDVSPATLSAEVADLAFLAASEPNNAGMALIGFDLGGMAAVALAGSGSVNPGLVIGLDSGVMSERLTRDLLTSRSDFAWRHLSMPYVHFTRTAAENVARDLPESLAIFELTSGAPRTLIRIPQMRHADFTTIGAIESVHPALFGEVQGDPALGFATMAALVKSALDHHIWFRSTDPWKAPVRPPITAQVWP